MKQMSIEKAGRNSEVENVMMRMLFHSCFSVSKGGIVHLSVSSFSSHTYSIHNISSMFGLTEINNNKKKKILYVLVRQKVPNDDVGHCTQERPSCVATLVVLSPSFSFHRLCPLRLADTNAPDALV